MEKKRNAWWSMHKVAMSPSKLRKAMGTVNDQTSFGLAKVASTKSPDLDVTIMKATSHDEVPTNEKYYIQETYLCSRGCCTLTHIQTL